MSRLLQLAIISIGLAWIVIPFVIAYKGAKSMAVNKDGELEEQGKFVSTLMAPEDDACITYH